jgi:hypothetical protein
MKIKMHAMPEDEKDGGQSLFMNSFIISAFVPGGDSFTCHAWAGDEESAKRSLWHCSPHAIILSVKPA